MGIEEIKEVVRNHIEIVNAFDEMGDNEKLYQERLSRIRKANACEPVDRVPVIFQGEAFAPRYIGMTLA